MATINGTSGNDILTGTSNNDTIVGGAGNDTISGGAGDDKLNGGAGNDTISGGTGNDTIEGGQGDDILSGDAGNDTIKGGEGADIIRGDTGSDVIDAGSGNDIVIHTSLSTSDIDIYTGGSGFDTLVFELTTPEYTILKNEIDALKAWIANHANSSHWADCPPTQGYDASPWFIFNSIHLAVKDFEAVTVKIINTAPVANNDSLTTSEDTPLNNISSTLLANDTDVDSNPLQIIAVSNAVNGTVTLQNGQVSFIPTADFYGIASFQYQISDGAGGTATASVKINVTEVNDAPIANPDKATVAEDSVSNIINVLNNDKTGPANESAQTLTVTAASALHGSVSINADNTLSYTPDADYNGPDTITYSVIDNGTTNGSPDPKSATSTVKVTVTEVNDAPTANPDKATVAEDSVSNIINVLNNDTTGPANESAQMLTVTAASALHGSVNINADNTLSYTPDADYNGPDTITYSVIDNGTTNGSPDPKSATSTVKVTVTEVNDAPIANPDSATLAEDFTVFINVLANDRAGPTNENGQTLTVTSASAQHGNVTINPNGILSYTPFANFSGADTINYTVTDDGTTNGAPDPKSASSIVNLTITPVNDSPIANPDTLQTAEDTPLFIPTAQLLANDIDPDGPALNILNVFNAINGTTIFSGGTTTFIPSPDFNGTGSFQYLLSDGAGGTSTGTVTINISEVNDAPIANSDSATLTEDSTVFINVLANDRAGPTNENGQTLTVTNASAQHGNVTINPNGILSYTPFANFSGADTINYTITDNGTTNGAPDPKSASSIVNLTITPVNDSPIANPDTLQTAEDTPLFIPTAQLLANDIDPDGPALTILNVFNAINGTTIFSGGTTTFLPFQDFYGTGSFQYLLSDGAGGTSIGLVTINISEVNDAPIARPDSATVNQGSTNNIIPVLANDSAGPANESGQILTVINATAANGSVVINPNGTLSYTPTTGFAGVDNISYSISDNGTTNGLADPKTASSNVSIIVNPILGSIGDLVYGDNNGDGTFNGGDSGLVGIGLELFRDGGTLGQRDAGDVSVGFQITDSAGHYRFTNLSPGSYWVDVDNVAIAANYPGYSPTTTEPLLVQLSPGQNYDMADFGYAPGGTIGDLVYGDTDANGIFNSPDSGLVGIGVELLRDAGIMGQRDAGDISVGFQVTNSSGHYLFTNLAPGDYWVDVDENAINFNYPGYTLSTNNEPLLVHLNAAQNYDTADFGYARAGTIGDLVYGDADANGIFNSGDTGLVGIGVELLRDAGIMGQRDAGDISVGFQVTNSSGIYLFTNLAPDDYWVDVDEAAINFNYPGYTLSTNNEPLLVHLNAAQNYDTADFGYAPGGTIGDLVYGDADVNGVFNGFDSGLVGIGVELLRDAGIMGQRDAGDISIGIQVTNSSGHYLFTNLAPDDYWVDVDEAAINFNYPGYILTTNNEPLLVHLNAAQHYDTADFGYALQSLFTNGDDSVDFNLLNPQNYDPSSIYNALDGNDSVVLPTTPSIANLWNFNTSLPFMGGAGDDQIDGHLSTLDLVMQGGSDNDVVSGGWGYDTVIYNAGDGSDSINGGAGNNTLQLTGSTGDDSIRVIDLSIFVNSITNDFRMIQTAEETYFSDHSAYTSDLSQLVVYGLSPSHLNNPYNDAAYVVTLSGGSYSITTPDVGLKLENFIHLYDPTTGIAGPAFVDATTTPVSFYENNVFIGDSATTLLEVTNSSTHDISHFNNIQTAIITGGTGNDTLIGGAERDTFVYHAGDGADFMDGGFESLNNGPLNTLQLTGSAGDDTITITNLSVLANAIIAEMRAINSAEVAYQSSLSMGYATLLTDLVTAGILPAANLINPYTHNSNWNYSVTTVNGMNVSYDLQAINVGLQTSQQGTINIYDPVSHNIVQPFDTLVTTPVSFYDANNQFIATSTVSLVEVTTPTGDTTSQIKNILNVVITGGTGDDTLTGGPEYNTFVYHAGDGSDHMDGGSIGFPNTLDVSGSAGDDTIRITNLSTIADAVVAKMRGINSAEVTYASAFSSIGYAPQLTNLTIDDPDNFSLMLIGSLENPYTHNNVWDYSVKTTGSFNSAYDLKAIGVGLETNASGTIYIYDPVSNTIVQAFDTLSTTPISFYDANNHFVADSNSSVLEVNNVTSYMLNIQHFILTGGAGNDILIGGSGDDTFVYQAGDGSDHMNGFGGENTLQLIGSTGNDIFQIVDYTALASAIQTDLNLIKTAEEAYFSDNQTYTADLSLLVASGLLPAASLTNPYNHAAYQVAISPGDFSVTTDGVGMQVDQSGVHRYDPVTQTINDAFVSPFATPVLFYDQDGNDIANSITSNQFEVQTATSDTTSLFANIQHYEYVTTAGNDTVTGSATQDTYIVSHDSIGHGVTEVTNFSLANDQIDLSRVLPEEAYSVDPFGTYINFDTSSGVNTVIGIDLTGGGNFDTVAILDNVLLTPADQNNYIL